MNLSFSTLADKLIQEAENTPKCFKQPDEWGDIYCSAKQLTSLEGAPRKVTGYFHCNDNELTTLKGGPQHVDGSFMCSGNKLTSLEGAPQHIGQSFVCSVNRLTSLEGVPQYIGGNFRCYGNPDLPFLELARMDLGNKVGGNIYFEDDVHPTDKTKCTRAYYEAVKHTSAEEQEDITNI